MIFLPIELSFKEPFSQFYVHLSILKPFDIYSGFHMYYLIKSWATVESFEVVYCQIQNILAGKSTLPVCQRLQSIGKSNDLSY